VNNSITYVSGRGIYCTTTGIGDGEMSVNLWLRWVKSFLLLPTPTGGLIKSINWLYTACLIRIFRKKFNDDQNKSTIRRRHTTHYVWGLLYFRKVLEKFRLYYITTKYNVFREGILCRLITYPFSKKFYWPDNKILLLLLLRHGIVLEHVRHALFFRPFYNYIHDI